MRTAHSKCNTKKNRLQKRVRQLQSEQNELRAKLLKYECDLEEKEKYIKNVASDYEQIISDLKLELRKSKPSLASLNVFYNKSFDFRHRIVNWIMYSVYFAFAPTMMKLSVSNILGYRVNCANFLPDFLLILFSISGSLQSMIMDNENNLRSKLKLKVNLFLTIIIITSLVFSICLSIPLKFMFVDRILTQPVAITVLLLLLYLLIMVIIVIGFIVIIHNERETRKSCTN